LSVELIVRVAVPFKVISDLENITPSVFVLPSFIKVSVTESVLSSDVVINTLSPDLTYIHGKFVLVILTPFKTI